MVKTSKEKENGKVVAASKIAATPQANPEKTKALDVAISQIDKQFGKGSIMFLGQKVGQKVEVVPTGSMLIDEALGVGGFPRGRIIEIFGPEASGKTTLALHAIAQAQKKWRNLRFY